MRPWIRRYPISWTFAPGGRLSYEAYKVNYVFLCKASWQSRPLGGRTNEKLVPANPRSHANFQKKRPRRL